MECNRGNFRISDDVKDLPITDVVRLHREVYGFDGYSEDTVLRLLGTSLWLGLYDGRQLIGFARAVTDKVTLSHLCDLIIGPKFQRQGLGKWLMECFLEHPSICHTFIGLGTTDKHSFFQKFGFENVSTMRCCRKP